MYGVETRYDGLTPWVLSSRHRYRFLAHMAIYFGRIEGFDYRVIPLPTTETKEQK